ncbi:heavy metal translocating P-type ATPase [Salinimicrobium tongyeongense]|uniref:P-type Zn(2+) transporter n=1 Tax=Salinimicrobium tongyeongense TaxID=2809707 RepID=A0ABY6NNM2_9FLAO|nr:heavy metal translocating P-type ATPase [Salinimicrobium tongyeongense]UZH54153.1 heavy metal translocating P-type ATPase [Salinimicrobium tongyeongense]
MKKIELDIPVLLPDVPDEKDHCVSRIMDMLEGREGIDKVHVKDNTTAGESKLCIHFQPEIITLERVQEIARNSGAKLTDQFSHVVYEVEGVRHQRHARTLTAHISDTKGVIDAQVSGSGTIRVEFDRTQTNEEAIKEAIRKNDLEILERVEKQGKSDRPSSKEQSEHKHEEEGHEHTHGGIFGANTELIFAIICGSLLGIGFGLSFIEGISYWIPLALYIGAYFFGGYYTAKEAIEAVAKGNFEIDFLMLVAAIGAAALGEWAEGALLLFLFSIGHALEHYAMNKARKSIAALADLAPKTALVRRGDRQEEVPVEALKRGDVIIIKPNSKISADGVVVKGTSSVNQAPITGESVPVDKRPVEDPSLNYKDENKIPAEHRVFSGTINGSSVLEVKVIKEAKDSTLSRLVKLVKEAETQKSPTQQFTDKFEKYFVPSVLTLVVLLLFAFLVIDETFGDSFYRAMAVLVAASPCALAISTPSAVLSGVARAARGGVLIKGGRPLEDLGELTALAFDKTGTLTEGKPKLTVVAPHGGVSEEELLIVAIAVEKLSDHPLAAAVVKGGKERLSGISIEEAKNLQSVTGRGVKAEFRGEEVFIGNKGLFEEELNIQLPPDLSAKLKEVESGGNTAMILRKGSSFLGIIGLMDTPKDEAKSVIKRLKKIGIRRMIMLTGDNQQVADSVAAEIEITDAWGGLLPEDKVDAIKKLRQQENKVAMVGDGVNDAPAMAKSTVGIAMGAAGSDVALETADIALMADNLNDLPFAIGLSRRSKSIIKQNLWVSLGVTALLIPATIFSFAGIGIAVLIHEGSTLVVVGNALRLLAYKK